ncbi:MAG: Histidine-tRNA ligase [Parcubacteria group bacterium GW2011_GWA2_46_9]|nr:MAG: Histidine-tRNA ligase [Parcubacteria group bacterium GW2011_GWA2_46_9]
MDIVTALWFLIMRKKTNISTILIQKAVKKTRPTASLKSSSTVTQGPVSTAPHEAGQVTKTRTPKQLQSLRGMRDILPSEQSYWQFLKEKCLRLSEEYGFERIDVPVLEAASLFERAIGKVTDIVEKEMFTFPDRGGDSVTLRPEFTAGAARAYLEHGFMNQPQPVKWYYEGSVYRYQRPQYGRQREFHQWGFEIFGDAHPVIDASLMMLAANLYADLGLPVTLQLNSVGDVVCRAAYEKVLLDYYRSHRRDLCEDCIQRTHRNPLRLLDCKQEQCQPIKAEAPQFVDHLCEACRDHLMKILEYLDELDISYVLNPYLVRGLDYYTRTVFEVWSQDDEMGRTALAGGGRYDRLLETLGGRPTPACGLSIGMEVAIIKMKESNIEVPVPSRPAVFIAQLGEPAKRKAIRLFEELRRSGVKVAASFSKDGLKAQMDAADKLGVRYAVILGQKEIMDGTIIIRDMEAGIQEIYDFKKIIPEIHKKLEVKSVVHQKAADYISDKQAD